MIFRQITNNGLPTKKNEPVPTLSFEFYSPKLEFEFVLRADMAKQKTSHKRRLDGSNLTADSSAFSNQAASFVFLSGSPKVVLRLEY